MYRTLAPMVVTTVANKNYCAPAVPAFVVRCLSAIVVHAISWTWKNLQKRILQAVIRHYHLLIRYWTLGYGAQFQVCVAYMFFQSIDLFALFYVAPEEKATCIKSLLSEQRDLSLQAAGHSLSAVHLRQRLYIYQRYFTALARHKPQKVDTVKRSPDRASPSIDAKLQVSLLSVCPSVCVHIS